MDKLRQLWIKLRASLWLVPGLILGFSVALAFVLIEVDTRVSRDWLMDFPTLFGLGADGSRGMLTAIGGSMLTVAALTFSLTLAALAQASSQFTPRILRTFMSDRLNQFVLGYFVSVFAYCLIVLRTIRSGDTEARFIPSLAVIFGLVLALGGIVVLIYFIHHIADSLQVTSIINNITEETYGSIKRVFPEKVGKAAPEEKTAEGKRLKESEKWLKVPALESGYIQSVNQEGLVTFAVENNLVLKMRYGIGEFIVKDAALASVLPDSDKEIELDKQFINEINDFYSISNYRTIEQDVSFGIQQIVDIALKALSPGVNDTTTAVNCIHYLGAIVGRIAERDFPGKVRVCQGAIRVLVKAPDFRDFVESAFDQIRISGKGNQTVFETMLTSFGFIAEKEQNEENLSVLRRQVDLIAEFAEQTLETDYEKLKVAPKITKTRRLLDKFSQESK